MAWKVQLRLGDYDLDLYEDETIIFEKKLTDFEKVDTVWNDFSQSFTIPATETNKAAFDFYHRIDYSSTFDPAAKNNATLFINRIKYSTGVLTLNEIGFKGYDVVWFKIQFFSETTNLKEILGDSTLADIDMNAFNHANDSTTIGRLLDGNDYFLEDGSIASSGTEAGRYVMGSIENAWQWNTSGFSGEGKRNISDTAYNANNDTAGIKNTELRPAFLIKYIIKRIFEDAGFDYVIDSSLATSNIFNNAYVWYARKEGGDDVDPILKYETGKLIKYDNTTSYNTSGVTDDEATLKDFNTFVFRTAVTFTPIKGEISLVSTGSHSFVINTGTSRNNNAGSVGPFDAPTIVIRMQKSIDGGNTWSNVGAAQSFSGSTFQRTYTASFNAGDIVRFIQGDVTNGNQFQFGQDAYVELTTAPKFAATTNAIESFAPAIKQIDFLSGILRAFNALLFWDEPNQRFQIVNRADFYDNAGNYDLTEYVDWKTWTMRPNTIYKDYAFTFEEPEDLIGENFYNATGRYFAHSTLRLGNYLGDEYKVELPFTPCQTTEIVTTNTIGDVTYNSDVFALLAVDDSYGKVDAGCRIGIYESLTADSDYTIREQNNTANHYTASTYNALNFAHTDAYGFSFNQERLGVTNGTCISNLLSEYYTEYLNRLFNKNVRLIDVEALIPWPVLRQLSFSNSILIGNNRYILQSMKVNIQTGKTKLTLINNFNDY